MGRNSSIGWCHHTFNPWMGCLKVSSACEQCYAEQYVNHYHGKFWGPAATTPRKKTSDGTWRNPTKWNKEAAKNNARYRVFCASLADVFEDHPMVEPWRIELFNLIANTPYLDWLLLTKRPENILKFIPEVWRNGHCPKNIWFMTTTEDQETYDKRWPEVELIREKTGNIAGVSMEPLRGYVDLRKHKSLPDWVIVGGESGPLDKIERLNMNAVKDIQNQLPKSTAFFFKQVGSVMARELKWGNTDPRGENPMALPSKYDWCKVREFPYREFKTQLF